ncbi:hypothetical protein [Flammeovirga pacifica]|uniref:Uncharacterized protein n=1 Tax=Flammeovirga pacifica TaxID=915059 RepID=A0A1S1YSN8_FLAPC|nr:hypothetical protein [Flammeovirga pacifica]OHX63883.1 hypothetical protein NH26_19925 [Flammeovirga pacifica]
MKKFIALLLFFISSVAFADVPNVQVSNDAKVKIQTPIRGDIARKRQKRVRKKRVRVRAYKRKCISHRVKRCNSCHHN